MLLWTKTVQALHTNDLAERGSMGSEHWFNVEHNALKIPYKSIRGGLAKFQGMPLPVFLSHS